jgi:hypothetical protein
MHTVVNGNVLGLPNELLVHHHRETVDVENLIRFFRFIQNHGQLRPGSPAHMKKDANGCDLLVFEVLLQDLFRRIRNMNH